MLNQYDFEVEQCYSGKQAMKQVKKNSYDILFIDYYMPDADGLQVVKSIRKHHKGYKKPFIYILTSSINKSLQLLYQQVGADMIFEKPLQLHQLEQLLHKNYPHISFKSNSTTLPPSGYNIWYCLKEAFRDMHDIDFNSWMKYTFGKHDLCIDLIHSTKKEINQFLKVLEKLNYKGKKDQLRFHIHGLKSLFSYIGARRLYELAKDLEWTETISQHQERCQERYQEFKKSIIELNKHLDEALYKYEYYTTDTLQDEQIGINYKANGEELIRLTEYIQAYDYNSIIELLHNMIQFGESQYQNHYQEALVFVKNYQYEEALDIIKKLEEQ